MKYRAVPRLLALAITCACVALVAAAPRTPAPLSRPSPVPLTTPTLHLPSIVPTVIIYPFDTSGSLTARVGTQIASIFSQQFTHSGHVTVLPVPAGIARSAYLTNARSHNADYYVSGYVTPIGQSVSVVVQVVSTQSGVIVYAQTGQLYGINDALSLALNTHDAIMQLSGANVNVATTESATAAPSPEASNGAQFNLGGLFSHHAHATPRPASSATPQAKPDRGVILLTVRGTAAEAALGQATELLGHDLAVHFNVRDGGAAPANLVTAADSICGANRDNTIATGTLAQKRTGSIRSRVQSTFTLQVWTCFGAVLYQSTQTNPDIAKAISGAVSDYITSHPANS